MGPVRSFAIATERRGTGSADLASSSTCAICVRACCLSQSAAAVGLFLSTFAGTASAELVASPIGRARHTAEIIHARLGGNSPLRFDDRLREISLGSWEGLDRVEIAARVPGIFDGDGHYEWYFHTPDGETYDAFSERIADWLGSSGNGTIIVVTHGIVSRVLRGLYAGLPRTAALRLPVPQDRVFRLVDGAIHEKTSPRRAG